MIRKLLLFFAMILGALAGASPVVRVSESKDGILGTKIRTHLALLQDHLGFPDFPRKQGIVLAVSMGAATGEIVVVGPVSGDAKAYSDELLTFALDNKLPANIHWAKENDGASAMLTWGTGEVGRTSGEQTLPLGGLVDGFRTIDPEVHTSLRVPRHAELANAPAPKYTSSKSNFFDESAVKGSDQVTVGTTLPGWMPLAIILFVALVPVCTITGIFAGMAVAKKESIPLFERRKIYSKCVYYGAFGSIFLHLPLAMWLMFTGKLTPIADLWFGSTSVSSPFGPMLILPMLVFIPMLALANRTEKKLFGPLQADPLLLPPIIPPSA